jgi:hypothetical protein
MGRTHQFAKEKVVFAPATASLTAPTRAEINAGIVLVTPGLREDEGVRDMAGFEQSSSFIDVPDAATRFNGKIPGRTEAGDPSLTLYESDATHTKRTSLGRDTVGFVYRFIHGDVPGTRMEVYPVTVASTNTSQLTSGNDATTFETKFAITAEPEQNAVVPA